MKIDLLDLVLALADGVALAAVVVSVLVAVEALVAVVLVDMEAAEAMVGVLAVVMAAAQGLTIPLPFLQCQIPSLITLLQALIEARSSMFET